MEITRMRTMLPTLTAALISTATLLPTSVWAWGTVGHRTIAEIAESLIQPATAKRIGQILPGKSMASVSTWADAARDKAEWSSTAWYHFEKIYEGKSYIQNLRDLPQTDRELGGVVAAILQAEKIFTSSSSTDVDKLNALKFIIHFVGDVHQPLHTGRPDDKGGNKIPRVWNGFKTNLHAIWDSSIIELGHEDIFPLADKASKEDVYAPYLMAKFKDVKLTTAQLTDVSLWVDESLAMRPDAYTYMDENEEDYTHRFIEDVDARIYLAGVRLAAMLNQMVIKEKPPTARVQFLAAIEKVTGSLSKFIFLSPRVSPVEDGDGPEAGKFY